MEREKIRVLVVEDEEAHAELIERAFESSRHPSEVTVARSLRAAREVLEKDKPDLVLVDVLLPDGRGTELLPGDIDKARYPAVIMTSHGDEQMAVDALKAGAIDYVVKSPATFHEMPHLAERTLREWRHITERHQAEKALRESEKRLQSILDNAPTVVYMKNLDGRYIMVNRRFEQLFRVGRDKAVGKHDEEILPAETAMVFRANDRAVLEVGDALEFDETATHEDGERTYLSVKFPLADAAGESYAICSISTDITERRKAEEERKALEAQLRQSKKLETIGTLAGGIAHDFNNILTPLIGFAEMALEDTHEGTRVYNDLEHVLKAAWRAKDLVKHILTFSRQAEPGRELVDLEQVIDEALQLIEASLPKTIVIKKEIDADCGSVWGDSTQLIQLLMNLCTNAYHAMRTNGGVLKIELTKIDISKLLSDLPAGAYARLTVTDTGHGMDQETLERIFDPFFTRKGVNEGTGLGLSVVHGIVKALGGEIHITSEPGKGTVVEVDLPLAEKHEKKTDPSGTIILRGDERVLLVDDEDEVAQIGSELLGRLGYQVTMCTSSNEAFKIFAEHPHDFDVVVTDQTMPGLTGAELAVKILEIRPDLPIIMTTGFSETMTPEKSKKLGIREYILKPLVVRELGQAIRRALDQEPEDGQPPEKE